MSSAEVTFRHAAPEDSRLLAALNHALIRDEGHRNPMTVNELDRRMEGWLRGECHAVIFEVEGAPAGYVLYRREPDYVYLRQFFVDRKYRRRGIGRTAMSWLRENAWAEAPRLRLDVLVNNPSGMAFWRALGFRDYCLTMELEP